MSILNLSQSILKLSKTIFKCTVDQKALTARTWVVRPDLSVVPDLWQRVQPTLPFPASSPDITLPFLWWQFCSVNPISSGILIPWVPNPEWKPPF